MGEVRRHDAGAVAGLGLHLRARRPLALRRRDLPPRSPALSPSPRPGPARYPLPLRLLHAVTAVLVAVQVGLAAVNAAVYEGDPVLAEAVVQAHLSLGALVFALTLLRLALRLSGAVPPPAAMTPAARRAARLLQAALYALLILLPVSGYLKLAALGFQVVLFGLLPLPPLPFDPAVAAAARALHAGAAVLLGLLLVGHVGAAVLHARLFGQPVLARMFPLPRPSLTRRAGRRSSRPGWRRRRATR